MVYAVVCALLFSGSMVYATRSARAVGVERATLARILIAVTALGLWSLLRSHNLSQAAVGWLLLSGVVGMGLGDIAMFRGLPLIGGRLMAVVCQCLTAPLAVAFEWFWLGTPVEPRRLACIAVILLGIGLSMAPDQGQHEVMASGRRFWWGVALAVGSALGTAVGAVFTRRALSCLAPGQTFDAVTAAWLRMVGGAAMTMALYRPVLHHWWRRWPPPAARPVLWRYRFTVANALCGSVLGMAAMQQALAQAPAGPVLAITSTAPLGTMLLLWRFDGLRPTRRAMVGGVLAVGGVVAVSVLGG